jgi:hypothetical protein
MREHKEIYTELLSLMMENYPLGEHRIGGTYIEYPGNGFKRICLYEPKHAPSNTFSLVIYAGDTCNQARVLFKHFSYAKVLELEKSEWITKSHFHFAWQSMNLPLSINGDGLALNEYIEYWRWALKEGYIRKYNKSEFDLLLKRMQDSRVMNNTDIAGFNEYFRVYKYQSVITCPGIINIISHPIERLKEDTKILAAELKEKTMLLFEIYG